MTTPPKTPNRTARLLATLRDDGIGEFASTVANGVAWRTRRVHRRQHDYVERLLHAHTHLRVRRRNEAPTPGLEVSTPRITVIGTSRDRAELLGLALRSVQLQDFIEWECLVVDDASLDDAVHVAQSFAAVDPRFTVRSHDRVRGFSAALVIEILSPDDETWDKLPFYAARGVDEVVVVDAINRSVVWMERHDTGYRPVDRSAVLDVVVADLVDRIVWPPVAHEAS